MNCAGINLNPQTFSAGVSNAVEQILVDSKDEILKGFAPIKKIVVQKHKDLPNFFRTKFEKVLGHPIPDNTLDTLSIEEKTELNNLKKVMEIIIKSNPDAIPIFDSQDVLNTLYSVLTVAENQDESVTTDANETVEQDVEQADENNIDDTTKLVLNQLGMSSSDFKKIVYTGATEEDSFRKTRLKQQIASKITRNGIYINDDPWVLNKKIAKLKNEWFQTICDYLGESQEPLFTEQLQTSKFTYNKFATGVLNRFKLKALNGNLKVGNNVEFKNAVNAFVNLISFDDELKDYMGKDISINRFTNSSFSKNNVPYGISSHNSLRSGWSTEELTDGMKNIPHMTKLLFNTIPEYKNGNKTGMFLNDSQTIITVKRFLTKCLRSNTVPKYIKNQIQTMRTNGRAKVLLNEMLNSEEYKNETESVISSMSTKEQVILRSFFRELYGEEGLYSQELHTNRNNSKATVLDALIHAVTQVDMMAYQSTDLKSNWEGTTATQYLRESTNVDSDTLDIVQAINQEPHSNYNNYITTFDDHWELKIPGKDDLIVQITPDNKYGYTTTNNDRLKLQIFSKGRDVTSHYINQEKSDSTSPDFNNNALTSDNNIKPEYQQMMDFIVDELHLRTSNDEVLNELLGTMQGEFKGTKFSGFSGALMSAVRSQMVKHIVREYMKADTDYSIQNYYNPSINTKLPPSYRGVNILSASTIISADSYGINYKIVGARRDSWINAYGIAKQILEGTNMKSTMTSSDNKKQPAVRQYAYGLNPRERIREQLDSEGTGRTRNTTNATTSLMFAHNIASEGSDLLADTAAHVDLEVTDSQGNTKQIKSMNVNEMTHHAIFDNFYNHFWDDGEITFQPMDYSDKGVQIVYTARGNIKIVNDNGESVDIQHATPQQIQQLYKQSIGGFYTKSLRNTLIDISNSINRNTYPSYPVSTHPEDNAPIHINQSSTRIELLEAAKAIDKWMRESPTASQLVIGDSKLSTQSIYSQYLANPAAPYMKAVIGGESTTIINPETNMPYTNVELYTLATQNGVGITEEQLTDQADASGIILYKNMSYTQNKGKIRLNPALVYMGTLQFEGDNLEQRWNRNKMFFIQDMLKNNVSFKIYDTNYNESTGEDTSKYTDTSAAFEAFFNDNNLKAWRSDGEKSWNASHWVKGDYMILAKILHSDGSLTDLIFQPDLQLEAGDKLIINPMLDHYFQVDNLLSNNMRMTMIGSEFSDPLKFKDYSFAFNNSHIDSLIAQNPEQEVHYNSLRGANNFDSLIQNLEDVDPIQFELMESNLWNTSNKRSNIVTATLTPFAIGTKQGVARTVNLATIEDIPASVYNFLGIEGGDLDAMDGSTFTDGIQATFESWSMPGQSLGMDKKTIAHGYDNRTGGTVLLKHAQYAINNERMLMARASQINLEGVFKRMNDWKYSDMKWEDMVPIHLATTRFNNLYHQVDDGKWRQISRIEYDEQKQAYYTIETEVDSQGKALSADDKYYYKFNPITQELAEEGETINSTYELWQALGGMDTFALQGNTLIRSEGSQVGCAMVINNSITTREGDNLEYQPFKTYKIHYLANASGSKRIQGNINSVDRWFDNKKLKYAPMQMTRFGSQLDADHEVEDSSITLPTQAMAALTQGGVNPEYASEVYSIMGNLALETSVLNSDLVYDFMKHYNSGQELSEDEIQRFHETIGYQLVLKYSKQSDAELGDIILGSMAKVLRTGTAELKAQFKIPFSDSSLYSSLLPTLTSAINNVSIKAKLAGSALVLTPGYKIAQYFNYGDIDASGNYNDDIKDSRMAQDVYNEASEAYKNNEAAKTFIDNYLAAGNQTLNIANYSIRQRQLIQGYLHYLQDVHERTSAPKQAGEFLPNEVVRIKYTLPNGKEIAQDIRFDFNIKDYYNFVDAYDTGTLKEYLVNKGIAVDANASNFRLYDSIISPRDLAPLRYSFNYTDDNGIVRKSNIFLLDGIRNNANNEKLRNTEFRAALIALDNGTAMIGNKLRTISNVKKQSAEEIAPNAYAGQFDVRGKTIREARKILQDRVNDISRIRTHFGIPYLCAFTLANNKHTIISLQQPPASNENASMQEFDPELNTIIKQENGTDWIYKIDKDRQLLYKVGIRYGSNAEYFVKPYRMEQMNPNGTINSYQYYYIDTKVLDKLGLNKNEVVPSIIKGIYNTDDYMGVEVSPAVIRNFKENHNAQYSNWLSTAFTGYDVKSFINQQFTMEGLQELRNNWYKQKQYQILSSFEKTLETMVTRIPTATKQSFMAMNIVGFTGGTDNRIYVSHFQAWLQGSDY